MSRAIQFVRGAWRALPVESLVVALAAVGAIGMVHDDCNVWYLRLALAGAILAPLAVASHRLGTRRQAIVMVLAAGLALAALSVALPDAAAFRRPTVTWPYGLTLIAALLIPFVTAASFLRFVRRFFEETTTWVLFGGCALAGLAVICAALHQLFDLRIDTLGADAAIGLAAIVVLLYLDRMLADDASGRVPELWRRLATVIGAPFVCVMLGILVTYEAVAFARGELPRNVLSPLILAAGLVGFVTTTILTAVLDIEVGTATLTPADPHRWARRPSIRLARGFPVVLLALLPLAAWALYLRIDAYGLTPFRAVRVAGLACLAVLGVASTVRWARKQPPLTWQVPATIAACALVLSYGPLGAVERSAASQAARLGRLLAAHHLAPVVRAEPVAQLSLDYLAYRELEDQLAAIAELGGEPALRGVLHGDVAPCAPRWAAEVCLTRLGVTMTGRAPAFERFELTVHGRFRTEAGELEPILLQRDTLEPAAPSATPELVLLDDAVVLYADGHEIARAALGALVEHRASDRVLPPRRLELRRADATLAGWLSVTRLAGETDGSAGAPRVTRLDGFVVWPAAL